MCEEGLTVCPPSTRRRRFPFGRSRSFTVARLKDGNKAFVAIRPSPYLFVRYKNIKKIVMLKIKKITSLGEYLNLITS